MKLAFTSFAGVFVLFFLSFSAYAATSGIEQGRDFFPAERQAGINPSSGSVLMGNEFTAEIIAFPKNPATNLETMNVFSQFKVEVVFDPDYFKFIEASLPVAASSGFSVPEEMDEPEIKQEQLADGKIKLIYTQQKIGLPAPIHSRQTALLELTFLPLKSGSSLIELKDAFVLSPNGANAIDSAKLGSLQLTITEGTASGGGGRCIPKYLESECGTNGCGGSYGECEVGEICKKGTCECLPLCGGKNCGGDSCGGSCGECPGGQVCSSGGICVAAGTAQQLAVGGGSTGEEARSAVQKPESLNIYLLAGGIVMVLAAVVGGIILYAQKPESPQL